MMVALVRRRLQDLDRLIVAFVAGIRDARDAATVLRDKVQITAVLRLIG